ncbi:MAG: ABC transporter substrate-binding protein [Acidimicrobiales bacterium]
MKQLRVPSCTTGHRPSRRRLLARAGAAACVAVTTMAAGSLPAMAASSGSVTLTFWSWVPGIQASVNMWNKSHPNIQVKLDEVTSGNAGTYAKMFSALQAGNAPDLGQIEYATLPNFEHVGGLVDIARYGANAVKNDFVKWTWGQVSQGTAVYAIPQDTGPMGLFYRADLFKKYGLTVPKTWAQYMSDAQKLHKANPTAYIAAFPANDGQWFAGLAWQAGARWFSISGQSWVTSINDSASLQVANFWQQLISQHLVKIEPDFAPSWYKDLSDGTVLTWPSAVWGENTILTNASSTKGDWRVAPMPNWTSTPSDGNWGGSTTVVFKDTKYPQQATDFAEWLNTNPASITGLITKGGLYPADIAGQGQKVLDQGVLFYGGQNIWAVFRANSRLVNTNFQWGPIMSTTFTDMQDGFGNLSNGSTTISKVLDQAQSATISAMKSQGLSVKAA